MQDTGPELGKLLLQEHSHARNHSKSVALLQSEGMPSRAQVRWAKFRTSAVSVVALLILGVLFSLLTGGTLLQPKATIHMYIPDATGLGEGSPVRVDGIAVGKVQTVVLSGIREPNRVVKVSMEVMRQNLSAIPVDSYAQLSTETLIGDKFVDITSGTSPNRLEAGGELTFKEQIDMLKSLDMTQLEKNLQAMDVMLTGIEQGTTRVGQFIIGEGMYRDLLRRISEFERSLHGAVSTTSRIGQVLYSDARLREFRRPLVELDRSLAMIQSGQGTAGRWLRDPAPYAKLHADVQEFRRAIEGIRSSEFMQSDRQYTDWNSTLDRLIRTVDELQSGPLFGEPAGHDGLKGMLNEIRETVRDFREDPRKYMRLKVF
jgi:phospholipid/cholesterol/gamma-HCH transport system substrate-binding protein